MNLDDLLLAQKEALKDKCVVRLRTTIWKDKKGLYMKRGLTYLRRKSKGYLNLEMDANEADPQIAYTRILNINECKDGIYEVVNCNERRDWETGNVEEWDYELIPIME